GAGRFVELVVQEDRSGVADVRRRRRIQLGDREDPREEVNAIDGGGRWRVARQTDLSAADREGRTRRPVALSSARGGDLRVRRWARGGIERVNLHAAPGGLAVVRARDADVHHVTDRDGVRGRAREAVLIGYAEDQTFLREVERPPLLARPATAVP